jgi:hypothetical protein
MKYLGTIVLILAVSVLAAPLWAQQRDDNGHNFHAKLVGVNEVPLTLSGASGDLKLTVNHNETSVHFVLTYKGLQTTVLFSHIHVGQPNVNGGVTVFFCGGGGRPACPQVQPATVEGDFTAADVMALSSQQLPAGDLALLLQAIRDGKTYANVHTMSSMGGEIRGQIGTGDEDNTQ